MNQEHSSRRVQLKPKTFIKWGGIVYLAILHIVVLAYFLPAVTIFKNEISFDQAKRIAFGGALQECLNDSGLGDDCRGLKYRYAEEYTVGFNQSGARGWSFMFKIGDDQEPVYWNAVAISSDGEIIGHTELGSPKE